MVIYFNRKDMISFGEYLLSEKRKNRFEQKDVQDSVNQIPLEERLKLVGHWDIENWIEDNKHE